MTVITGCIITTWPGQYIWSIATHGTQSPWQLVTASPDIWHINHQYATLISPNKIETTVCGSSTFVCRMTGEANGGYSVYIIILLYSWSPLRFVLQLLCAFNHACIVNCTELVYVFLTCRMAYVSVLFSDKWLKYLHPLMAGYRAYI